MRNHFSQQQTNKQVNINIDCRAGVINVQTVCLIALIIVDSADGKIIMNGKLCSNHFLQNLFITLG